MPGRHEPDITLEAGDLTIGKLSANSGVDIGDVDILTLPSDVAAAEDAALGKGMLIQADDGTDRHNVLVDTDGHLQIDILTGGGAGTQYTEDVVTANPIIGGAGMMERDDALSALTPAEGDWAAMRCNANGALWVEDVSTSSGVAYTEDVATPNPIIGTATMVERDDVLSALAPAEGDWAALRCDANGALWITGKLSANSGVDIGDVDVTSLPVGSQAMAAATPVTLATDDIQFGAVGAAADPDGNIHGQLRSIAENTDALEALLSKGQTPMAISISVVPANNITDATYLGDIKFGESLPAGTNNIGDVDIATIAAGNNNIGNVDIVTFPAAQLGMQAMAASLSVTPANNISDATYIGDIKFGESIPAGTNAIGKLAANSGVDIGDVDVTSIVPGTAATNLGKAEDAAHSSGDVGVMPLAVRNDALATLAGADGDYAPLQVDANGALFMANTPVNATVTASLSETGSDQEILVAQGANTQIWIDSIAFTMTDAGTAQFHHDIGPANLSGAMSFDANGGWSHAGSGNPDMPLWKCGTNGGFDVTVSAGTINGTYSYRVVSV